MKEWLENARRWKVGLSAPGDGRMARSGPGDGRIARLCPEMEGWLE
jgi:hypothetical protein